MRQVMQNPYQWVINLSVNARLSILARRYGYRLPVRKLGFTVVSL